VIKTLAVLIANQKAYGKVYVVADVFNLYEMKFSGKVAASVVLQAIDVYTDTHNDIPQPADLNNIIFPAERKITQAEFIHAQKEHEKEGFPRFGYYGQIIKDYQRQNSEETGVPSHYQVLENRQNAPKIPDKVKEILAITYGGEK